MRVLRFGVAGFVAIAEAVAAAALVVSSNHDSHPWLTAGFAITAGLTFAGAGLVALWRRPENATGAWLAATGYLWFIAALTESNNSWVWTVGFILSNLAFVSFSALILAYPDGCLSGRDVSLIAVGGLAAVGGNTLVALLDASPATQCDSCPPSAIAVADSETAADLVTLVGTVIVIGVLAAIAAILVGRWRRASARSRRTLRPVFVTCGISVVLLLLSVAADQMSSVAYSVTWVLFLLSFALVPLSFVAGVFRSRFDRSSAARMLVSLDDGIPLRDALAQALHDPSLEIVYWLDSRAGWVDDLGHEVDEPQPAPTRSVTTIERGGRPIAALVHDPALDDEPELVELIATGAGLPLENVRLQADLRAQFRFLETVANTAPSLLVVIDLEGRIVNQNQATVTASGFGHEERIRGRHFWEVFIDEGEREGLQERFRNAAPDFAPAQYENTFTNAQGERRVIEWRSAPVTDASGRVSSIVAGGIDITERKQREVQLQRERDITDTLMQAIPSLVVVVDSKGIIVDSGVDEARAGVNNAFRTALGWPDSALVRRSVLDFVDPADGRVALEAINAAANGVAVPEHESRWLRADGERLAVAWTATPVDDVTGRTASLVLLSGVDVTERKQHEREIRASRARIIEAGDDARRVLERNLHDGAQQRLVSLSLSLRLAESKVETDPAAAVSIINASREELAAALDELRELARGIHPAVLTDRGLAAALETLMTRTPFPVDLEAPQQRLGPAVEAAAYYVVSEALTNIAKYAQASSARVSVREAPGRAVIVAVVDDGIGGADPTAGTGLRGLSDRVAALDGTLTVLSPPGGGTRIEATIPLRSTEHLE